MRTLLFILFLYGTQSSPTGGSLMGIVRDATGAVLPGASIAARSLSTNQTRTTSSMEDGSYRFPVLPADDYEIRVNLPGFEPYLNPNIAVLLGRTASLDIRLNPAGITQDVAVTDQPLPIDPTATATTTTIDPERIDELPVNSQNYLEFTLLAPGVAPSNSQASHGTQGPSGSPLADSGFTFGGLRPRSNFNFNRRFG